MPLSDDMDKIGELEQELYARGAPDVRTRRKLRFADTASDVQTAWERPPEEPVEAVLTKKYIDRNSMSFVKKLFVASAVFCVVAVGIGAVLFFKGANLISANNIDIQISGPVSIPGGAPVAFDVRVVNKNNVDLEAADLSVEFPAGTTDPKDTTRELKAFRELLGDIPAGRSADKTVEAVIFGEENLQKQIAITVTYTVKGSTSVFTKTRTYDVLINSSPINVSVSSVKEITSGQEFSMSVSLMSNSEQPLKNVILKGAYPFGFTFVSSDIPVQADNATWRIGDIPPGGERVVRIRGKLVGEDSDERVFRFSAGAQSSASPNSIGTEYMTVEQHIGIEKPFISLKLAMEGDEGAQPYIASYGSSVRVELHWFNNLSEPVTNTEIVAHLGGTAYATNGVRPEQGYFRSATNDIIWNQQTNSELRSIAPGDSGVVSFLITPTDTGSAGVPLTDPVVSISASVSGNRTQESRVPEKLSGIAERSIRVASQASLSGRLVRTVGPITNTGPIPPKADQPTTYTVIWTVDNTSSPLSNASVSATIPPYVSWTGVIYPTSEHVTFDENSGRITWNVGAIGAHTAGTNRRREAAFQISFEPSVSQVDQTPTLLNAAKLIATDDFTGATIESTQDYLSTRFSTDPAYKEGNERVVR